MVFNWKIHYVAQFELKKHKASDFEFEKKYNPSYFEMKKKTTRQILIWKF